MGIWPFGKKNEDAKKEQAKPAAKGEKPVGPESVDKDAQESYPPVEDTAADAAAASGNESREFAHDAINGQTGPFDGDSVDIETFDFSDFSIGILDLGSLRIPLPKESQVQVEMGEQGPRMLHIVTKVGRITPVAFAAPRKPGQWAESVEEIREGMSRDGLTVTTEPGPWGAEVVGKNDNGQVRVIGADGPRWMLRMTLAAPAGMEADLAEMAREVAARTFVYRGEDPILAGNALPVIMPEQLVEQVKQAMDQRQQEQQAAANAQNHPENGVGGPDPAAEAEAEQHLRDLGGTPQEGENGSSPQDPDEGSAPTSKD
ncbi:MULTISPECIES: DUF3710 domain-containing protein [Corynebacterium]|uniref:DUF3710 domain-containing protein n=1 Tax=Corynebacterium TaxID=1716 RepID=UPI001908C13C|nr:MULTISPECIES: DUF3710 domain-containing protein [Corynebacterium]MCG7240014.1 DUF3710 domain-containing protein [Corynebacterium kefirresidentii]MCG7282282.1 DUF3710 domain-containing protein [Corynebacterium kefirresidentii]MDU4569076.1 DUF3710 domain-containing protein [Corynebacterium sp.]MDU6012775.1 DUF3710 domain-containing protein [Corynebacterium sp.]QQN48820.1 DUF3710 domain-containing protein [Corynebacterium kefirresidentii]